MCRQKDAKTVQGCALKTRSPCCAGYEFIFRLPPKNKSVLHADGLKKSLRRIFIAAALERRTANHHPCPPPRRRGTRGRINKYFKVDSLRLLQALTYPECRTAALHLPVHPSPFPAIGKGGGGKGQIRPWLPWERFCAQYGLIFDCRQKSIRIQHSQRQGSWGRAPSVFWFLLHE